MGGDRFIATTDVFNAVNNLDPAVVESDWTRGIVVLNGEVSTSDGDALIGYLGNDTAAAAVGGVPEPGSLLLSVLATVGLLLQRRSDHSRERISAGRSQ